MMELSTFAVSFPIDPETNDEVMDLLRACEEEDGRSYRQVLNEWAWTSADTKGFLVLAYEEERLVGAFSAIDMIGVHVYEWSGIVSPEDRRNGVGAELYKTLYDNLNLRGAEGNMALCISDSSSGKAFIEKLGFAYDFSEATLKADAFEEVGDRSITIRKYSGEEEKLIPIVMEAFGDTEEEVKALIQFNVQDPSRTIWLAVEGEEASGTVTTVVANGELWVTALAVHPLHSGKGIGSSLLRHCRAVAAENGVKQVMLDVETDNEQALSIYERAGFRSVQQVDYYKRKSFLS